MPDSEKSFGRKLLSFFVEEAPASPAPASPGGPGASAPAPAPAVPTPTGQVDTKFVDHFAAVLAKTNLQGPDYFEFRETLRSLASLGLNEEKQFQAAWASFRALGGATDVSVLTQTAQQYLTVLAADREAFLKTVDAALADKVGGLQQEQKTLQAENEKLATQLAELQNRMQANADRLSKIGGEVQTQTAKLAQNKAAYEATYAHFTGQIKADVGKMGSYLK